jgi:hypothetical protein
MGKATLMTPLYVSVAWTMMVSYQIFTQTAVSTVLTSFKVLWSAAGEWLLLRMDMVIFVYAFAWIFVLSSVIPSLLLGKERSVLLQFFVCLMLAFVAFFVQDSLNIYMNSQSQVLLGIAFLLGNPLFAVGYLSMPYVAMLALDIRTRARRKKNEQIGRITATYLEPPQSSGTRSCRGRNCCERRTHMRST